MFIYLRISCLRQTKNCVMSAAFSDYQNQIARFSARIQSSEAGQDLSKRLGHKTLDKKHHPLSLRLLLIPFLSFFMLIFFLTEFLEKIAWNKKCNPSVIFYHSGTNKLSNAYLPYLSWNITKDTDTKANDTGSDQTAHLCNLIWALPARISESRELMRTLYSCGLVWFSCQRLRVQTDPRLFRSFSVSRLSLCPNEKNFVYYESFHS